MRAERGFTLIEVLIAFAIAALALAAVFRGAGGGLDAVQVAGKYEEAVSRASSHLAALGRVIRQPPGEYQGDDGGGFHWTLLVKTLGSSGAPPAQTNGNPPPVPPAPITLYAVHVAIAWTEAGKTRSVALDSLRIGGGGGTSDEAANNGG